MTLSVLPAATTVLLGLLVVGTLDFLDSDGDTHWVAWVAFGLATAIVARDTLLGGGLLPFGRGDETRRRPQILGLELHGADVRLRVPRFEPIATTLAILLGLLTTQTIDFANSQGDATAWGWTVFALSITLVTGMRLSPSPAPPQEGGAAATTRLGGSGPRIRSARRRDHQRHRNAVPSAALTR